VTGCAGCPLKGPQCEGSGNPDADLVIVGEAPGRNEVQQGKPFVGLSGQILDQTLAEHGIQRKDTYVTNVVMCRPSDAEGKDAPPNAEMIAACSKRLHDEVTARHPKMILALGTTAAQRMAGLADTITKVQGVLQWAPEFGVYVLPTYHPAAVLHGAVGYYDDIYFATQRAVRFATGLTPIPGKYDPPWEFVRDDEERALELFRRWEIRSRSGELHLALDTETHGPHDNPRPLDDMWDMFQIADDEKAYAFPTWLLDNEELEAIFKRVLRSKHIVWIFHNLQFDQQVLKANLGVKARRFLDTMILGLGLTERGEQVGLKFMSRQWLNAPYYEAGLPPGIFKTGPQTDAEWLAEARYGCYDAWNTRELAKLLPALVREEGTMQLCRDLLLPAQDAFADVSGHGTAVDLEYAGELEDEWLPIIAEAERKMQVWAAEKGFPRDPQVVNAQEMGQLCECVKTWAHTADRKVSSTIDGGVIPFSILTMPPQADRQKWRKHFADAGMGDPACMRCMHRRYYMVKDRKLNVRSPLQLQHLAFDILRMPAPENRRSCDNDFLEYNRTSEFTALLRAIREKDHLLRSYIRGIAGCTWSDGRVHPDFRLFGTVTGRLAIREPAMQTLPKWGVDPKLAKLTRRMIVASPGYAIVDIDYKNLELFIAHHYSGDEHLLKALTEYDFHTYTAAGAFGKPYDEVTGLDRFNSKFITFGIAYGRQAYSLAMGELKELTGGNEQKAQGYIDRFWATYPDYYRVYNQWIDDAWNKGELRTPMGRVRRWRLLMPSMMNHVRNQAVNFPIQSLASDMCLSALIRLNTRLEELGYGRVLFTVHDSLVFEIRHECLDLAIPVIVAEMVTPPFETQTPFFVEVEVGPNLGEVEKYGDQKQFGIAWANERMTA
jgi:uracil-DNA glycosylase family 4